MIFLVILGKLSLIVTITISPSHVLVDDASPGSVQVFLLQLATVLHLGVLEFLISFVLGNPHQTLQNGEDGAHQNQDADDNDHEHDDLAGAVLGHPLTQLVFES